MAKITAQCAEPNDISLEISATMPVSEWRKVLVILKAAELGYYGDTAEFMRGISQAISAIEGRAAVEFNFPKERPMEAAAAEISESPK